MSEAMHPEVRRLLVDGAILNGTPESTDEPRGIMSMRETVERIMAQGGLPSSRPILISREFAEELGAQERDANLKYLRERCERIQSRRAARLFMVGFKAAMAMDIEPLENETILGVRTRATSCSRRQLRKRARIAARKNARAQ